MSSRCFLPAAWDWKFISTEDAKIVHDAFNQAEIFIFILVGLKNLTERMDQDIFNLLEWSCRSAEWVEMTSVNFPTSPKYETDEVRNCI